jgi:hypothetical protein
LSLANKELNGLDNHHAEIVAVITMKPETIQGGAPIFIVKDKKDLQKISMTLEKILNASAHEIEENTLIIVAR